MSCINGKGYGDVHNWKRDSIEESPTPEYRSTLFCCVDCGEIFRHYYHRISDIHEAMQAAQVKPYCGKQPNEWDDWAEEMCVLVDELAKKHISTDTPLFRFQQSMIHICRAYREAKENKE